MSVESPFFDALIGKPISHIWRGHGSAIFIEFGELTTTTKEDKNTAKLFGELSLMIEWSWRIEKPKSILGGSWSSEARWPRMFEKLKGSTVTNVEVYGHIPEVCVSLSNGLRITSFMVAEGQPTWSIISHKENIGNLCVKKGVLYVEPSTLQPIIQA